MMESISLDAILVRSWKDGPFAIVAGLLFTYFIFVATYRLWLHPLSKFPGPKWAAVSQWYQIYWYVLKGGAFMPELSKLHQKHGPIVRIGPNELSVNSPEFVQQIFRPGEKYVKDKYHYDMLCLPNALPGLTDPAILRVRREGLQPLFKKKAVNEYWPYLCDRLEKLVSRLSEKDEPVVILNALSCYTLDVISGIMFSQNFKALDEPNFRHFFQVLARGSQRSLWIMKYFPTLRRIAMVIAPYAFSDSSTAPTALLLKSVRRMIDDYITKREAEPEKAPSGPLNIVDHLRSPNAARRWVIPDKETLTMEGIAILGGGTETVAMSCMVGIYHILTKPHILNSLCGELDSLPKGTAYPSLRDFEQLPYLTAVIKEIIRYAAPVPGRLPRIVPEGGTLVEGSYIPPGTVVGMSAYLTHRVEEIFPEGDTFNPDRWLEPGAEGLDRYIITFAKGSGQCPGMSLAWAEMYLILGTLFRRFHIKLAEDASPECLVWTDHVVNLFEGPDLEATFEPIKC